VKTQFIACYGQRPHCAPKGLPFLRFAEQWRLSQGKENYFFTSDRADVMVQTYHLDTGDPVNHCLQGGPRYLNEMTSDFLEQVSAFVGGKCLDQMLFGGG